MNSLRVEQLQRILPRCPDPAAWAAALNLAMARFDIDSRERQAAFLAQVGHEAAQLTRLTENLNYGAKQLLKVWPGRFPTLDKALQYERNPQKLANYVYGKRLGNGDEDFVTITRRINGGVAGLKERIALWDRARDLLAGLSG